MSTNNFSQFGLPGYCAARHVIPQLWEISKLAIMSMLKMSTRLATVAASFGVIFTAQADECDYGVLSHVQQTECLANDYRGVDALLRQKLAQLLKIAEPRDMSNASAERVIAKRKQIQDAIRRADLLWRQSLEVECDTLTQASFGLGNGDDVASLECRISRTRERITFLSKSSAYDWLWQ